MIYKACFCKTSIFSERVEKWHRGAKNK